MVLYDKYTGEGFRAAIDLKKLKNFPETWNWFLKLKTKQEQDDKALRREILEHGAEMISVRPIRMKEEALKHKSKGPIAVCPVCGEAYPAMFGDKCPLCAKGRSYDLL